MLKYLYITRQHYAWVNKAKSTPGTMYIELWRDGIEEWHLVMPAVAELKDADHVMVVEKSILGFFRKQVTLHPMPKQSLKPEDIQKALLEAEKYILTDKAGR